MIEVWDAFPSKTYVAKINHKTKIQVCQSKIIEDLFIVNRKDMLCSLDFQNDLIETKKIDPVKLVEPNTFV